MTTSSALRLDVQVSRRSKAWVPQVIEGKGSAKAPEPEQASIGSPREAPNPASTALYESLRPAIQRALFGVLRGRPPEFEDLMQNTFERVIRTLADGSFQGRSQLATWASAIAANVAIDHLRRRSLELKLFQNLDSELPPGAPCLHPERQLEARSELHKFEGILGRMKSGRASVLVMHDVLGHSVPQVARALGLNMHTTRSNLVRARKELSRRGMATRRRAEAPSEH